jgi:hypothetical protein
VNRVVIITIRTWRQTRPCADFMVVVSDICAWPGLTPCADFIVVVCDIRAWPSPTPCTDCMGVGLDIRAWPGLTPCADFMGVGLDIRAWPGLTPHVDFMVVGLEIRAWPGSMPCAHIMCVVSYIRAYVSLPITHHIFFILTFFYLIIQSLRSQALRPHPPHNFPPLPCPPCHPSLHCPQHRSRPPRPHPRLIKSVLPVCSFSLSFYFSITQGLGQPTVNTPLGTLPQVLQRPPNGPSPALPISIDSLDIYRSLLQPFAELMALGRFFDQ